MRSTLKKLQQKNQDEGGFTLIELLVVIVIIGILAAVVVFAVGGITDRGEDKAKDADRRTLQTAEEAFFADQNVDAVYGEESDLVSEGFLAEESTLHDICLAGDELSYEIVDQGDCP